MVSAPPAEQRSEAEPVQVPIIRVTSYDQVWSTLVAVVAMLGFAVFLLFMLWGAYRPPTPRAEPVVDILEEEMGGVEDGSPTDSLKQDGPGPERPDATPSQPEQEQLPPSDEALQNASTETAEGPSIAAAVSDQPQLESTPLETPRPGKSLGTGTRPALGGGSGSKGGWPRHLRWYIHFDERGSLPQYAKQLDFFSIELGALLDDHTMVYISQLSSDKPTVRRATSGADEKRLFFTWQGGKRRGADVELFQKAGINIGPNAIIFHFYPRNTENILAAKELAYRNRPVRQIRRTFFSVVEAGGGFDFQVTRQTFY